MIYDYKNGIYGIDAHYEIEGGAMVYLLKSGDEAAFVETAHNNSLPYVLAAMDEISVPRESVKYICVTHVHLDHAGGAGAYMREFPNAKLVVHPRGARHMIDPTKLVAGVREVYGPEETTRLYGDVLPIAAERVIEAQDGQTLEIGDMRLECIDSPGHAKHHLVFFEKTTRAIFTGDAFGISYNCMNGAKGRWVFPTTAPVQFDPEAMKATIDRIVELSPSAAYLTHFGKIDNVTEFAASLKENVDVYVNFALEAHGDPEEIGQRLSSLYRAQIKEYGAEDRMAEIEKANRVDILLNKKGLACWYEQQQERSKQ